MYAISEDGYTIRQMKQGDVVGYISCFGYSKDVHMNMIQMTKKILKNSKEEEGDMNFVVLKGGVTIGAVVTKAIEGLPTDGTVEIDIPRQPESVRESVRKLFIKLARETWFYDDIYFVELGFGGIIKQISKPVPISVSSRWETSD